MKRAALVAALAGSTLAFAQQDPAPAPPQLPAASPIKATGCLQPGTRPGTYLLPDILIKFRVRGAANKIRSKRVNYELLVAEGASIDLAAHVGHHVEVLGTIELPRLPIAAMPTAVGSQTSVEIQRVTVRELRQIADKCP
jgi:hypothetical protein